MQTRFYSVSESVCVWSVIICYLVTRQVNVEVRFQVQFLMLSVLVCCKPVVLQVYMLQITFTVSFELTFD